MSENFRICERCHDNYAEVGSKLCKQCKETLSIIKLNEAKGKNKTNFVINYWW